MTQTLFERLQQNPQKEPFSNLILALESLDGPSDDSKYKLTRETAIFFVHTVSPFSQWHPSEFIIDGQRFWTAEQYMMFKKAQTFSDAFHAEKILNCKNPKTCQAFGRNVSNFSEIIWNNVVRDFVFRGNVAKFSQNPHLKEKLKETGKKILVEAAHYDQIWGVGLRETDPAILDIRTWRGTNWLGFILMDVRAAIC